MVADGDEQRRPGGAPPAGRTALRAGLALIALIALMAHPGPAGVGPADTASPRPPRRRRSATVNSAAAAIGAAARTAAATDGSSPGVARPRVTGAGRPAGRRAPVPGRRWTGIEPAGRGSPVPPALKAGEPTRRSDTSAGDRSPEVTGACGGAPRGRRAALLHSPAMKKLLALAVLAVLGWFAWKKIQEG